MSADSNLTRANLKAQILPAEPWNTKYEEMEAKYSALEENIRRLEKQREPWNTKYEEMEAKNNALEENIRRLEKQRGSRFGDIISPATCIGHPIREGDCWVGTTLIEKLNHFLKSRLAHKFILVLIVLDLIFVVAGIFFELHHLSSEVKGMEEVLEQHHQHGCVAHSLKIGRRVLNEGDLVSFGKDPVCEIEEEYGTVWLKNAEEICAICSFVILCTFLVENITFMVTEGLAIFTDCGNNWAHWFDFDIVVISFTLEAIAIFGSEEREDPFQLLMIGRLWRLGRVGEGVYEAVESREKIKQDKETEVELYGGRRMPDH